ncbi:hypothetical protein D3C86_1755290 [compost metagenome]
MIVGQHITIGGNNETGTQRLRFTLTTTARGARNLRNIALEEFAKDRRQAFKIGNGQFASPGHTLRYFLPGADVDHRWRGLFDQLGKVRQACLGNHRLPQEQ